MFSRTHKEIVVQQDLDCNLGLVRADRGQIEQAL